MVEEAEEEENRVHPPFGRILAESLGGDMVYRKAREMVLGTRYSVAHRRVLATVLDAEPEKQPETEPARVLCGLGIALEREVGTVLGERVIVRDTGPERVRDAKLATMLGKGPETERAEKGTRHDMERETAHAVERVMASYMAQTTAVSMGWRRVRETELGCCN